MIKCQHFTFMSGKNSILGLSEPKKRPNFFIFSYLCAFKISCSIELSRKKFYTSGPGMILAVFGPHSNLLKEFMVSMIHQSKWENIEIICVILVNPQNNMISDMPILFQ